MSKPTELHSRLAEVIQRASESYAGIGYPGERFAARVHQLVQSQDSSCSFAADLEKLHLDDLYLASAAADSDVVALDHLFRLFQAEARGALRRLNLAPDAGDEMVQVIWEKLTQRNADGSVLLAKYAARGSLKGWIRVVAANTALKMLARRNKEVPAGDMMDRGLISHLEDPELHILREMYRGEFKTAFRMAWTELTPRNQTLLQLRYIEGLTIDQLDKMYQVSRATVARWLVKARNELFDETGRALTARLGLNVGEFRSLIRLMGSRLDLTLKSIL